MRKAFVPGARHTHLLCAVLGGKRSNRVKIFGCELCSEKFLGRSKGSPIFDSALDPDFIDTWFLPIGEKAHAICARHDCVKVLLQFAERKVFVHVLSHYETRLNVQRKPRNYT